MRLCLCLGFVYVCLVFFFLYGVSILYDSAFLMFVVYRNKHEKVAFLLDFGHFGHCSGSSHETQPGERLMNHPLPFAPEAFA